MLGATGLALGACGSETPETPAACLGSSASYVEALDANPTAPELPGGVAIGDCLVDGQAPGQQSAVGGALVEAATLLNARATRAGGGRAAVELGYLDGAVAEAAAGTGGIHADLARRVDSAARFSKDPNGAGKGFERGFRKGYAAARSGG